MGFPQESANEEKKISIIDIVIFIQRFPKTWKLFQGIHPERMRKTGLGFYTYRLLSYYKSRF